MEETKSELVVRIAFDEYGLPTIDGMSWCGDPRKLFAVVYAIENGLVEYSEGDVFEAFLGVGGLLVRVPSMTTTMALWVLKRMVEGMAALLWEAIFATLHTKSIASRGKIVIPGGPIVAA